jgi:ligand-binding sensor domain-containing protein
MLPTPTATELPLPVTPTPRPVFRPPSGWTVFTNPDFVRGIAVYDGIIWAATSGGVVAWEEKTKEPTLYTTRDGLAEIHGSDVVVCATPQPRVVVAHPSGALSSFDLTLKKWSRITITFDDGSTLHGVRTLLCDEPNRRLLVGASDGLGILNEKTGAWRKIGAEEGLKVDTISAIAVTGQTIWVAAEERGAYMIMGSTVFPFNSAAGFPSGSVNDLSISSDAAIWFGYSTGLIHYRDKLWNSFGGQTSAGIPFQSVDLVEVGPERQVWIASAEEGACPFSIVRLDCTTVYPGVRGAPITDLVVDAQGTAYAATDGAGVLVLGSEQVQRLAFKQEQLVGNEVLDVAEDAEGKIWVSTGSGVNVFDPARSEEPWQMVGQRRNQLPFTRVTGMLNAPDGMWFTFEQEPQATLFDGKTWFQLDASKGMTGNVHDSSVDSRGYIWFATDQGIRVWDGTLMRSYTPLEALPGNTYYALHADETGMWVGTQRGLLRYERFQWQIVLPDLAVHAILPEENGSLLLGTDQGLVRYEGGQAYLWLIHLGQQMITRPAVTDIARDGSGELWVGTETYGLFHYNGQDWEQYSTSEGLPANHVRRLLTDRSGAVWVVSTTADGGGALVRYMP